MISRAHGDGINVIIMCSDDMYGLVKFLFLLAVCIWATCINLDG